MAMIKTVDEGSEINGRVGGDIYRFDQCGQHIQKEPRLLKSRTEKQKAWMRAWRIVMSYWKDVWELGYHSKWWAYAHAHPVTNRKGETYTLSAVNWFLKINIYRIINELGIQWDPPED